jgi:hypothetical protein
VPGETFWLQQASRHSASIRSVNRREQSHKYQECTREVPRCFSGMPLELESEPRGKLNDARWIGRRDLAK